MSDCIEFHGAKNSRGYGKVEVNGQFIGAHRLAYRLFVGPLAKGKVVRHTCDNPPCINPAHLRLGTPSENQQDSLERNRQWQAAKTHCANGHPYSEENTRVEMYENRRRQRRCLTCQREASRRYKARKREQVR